MLNKNNILQKMNLKKKNFFLATLHRPETVDNLVNLTKIINISISISTRQLKCPRKAVRKGHESMKSLENPLES